MNLFKYAIKNLKIYKYRTIIMIITLVLVATASVIGISIQSATKNVAQTYRDEIGAAVNIDLDYNKLSKSTTSPQKITPKQYEDIAKLKQVKNYSYLTELMIGSSQIKAVGEDSQKGEDQMGIVGLGENGEPVQLKTPKLKLIGGAGNTDLPEFTKGLRKITQGNAPKKDNEVLISEELAKLNNLKVGDTIHLNDVKESKSHDYKISGIYEDKTAMDGGSGIDMPIFNRRNEIITTFANAMLLNADDMNQVRATYEINDPKDFESFKDAVRKLGISDDYSISIDEKSYNKAVGPINNLNSTVSYFIIIILAIATGVLMLLSILSIKERQYEIGVLRAMGMKKAKVGMSFIVESVIILLISLTIGLGIGSISTKPIATTLLNQQIQSMQEDSDDSAGVAGIFTPDTSKDVRTVDSIDTSIDGIILAKIAGIGLIIILITNLLNIIYIMRFQPMEIMRKKN